MSASAVLYFDLASPYAYLAVTRAASVLGREPELEPVLLGAIFKLRGSGSWADTAARERHMSEIEARAVRYGLPPLAWPNPWPGNSLAAMRAATWAKLQGRGREFAHALFRAEFVEGRDLSRDELLLECAGAAGLGADELAEAIRDPGVKDRLRETTQRAWDAGVRGVPSLALAGKIFYGDDQLEQAAAVS